jgi:hypothetical protein
MRTLCSYSTGRGARPEKTDRRPCSNGPRDDGHYRVERCETAHVRLTGKRLSRTNRHPAHLQTNRKLR